MTLLKLVYYRLYNSLNKGKCVNFSVESPTSATKPKNVIGETSDDEQSDDDDIEIEAGQCEQSNDQMDVERFKS